MSMLINAGRWLVIMTMSIAAGVALAQSDDATLRRKALAALASTDATERAEAAAWIATNGRPADDKVLLSRLFDGDPTVREIAEQGLWVLWSRSGDAATDAVLARGVMEMQAARLTDAVATFSEVIAKQPDFAEGWNKRATALFLAGEFRRSLADCDEVIKRNPNHFGALAGYGQIYFQTEQYERAAMYWKRALGINPNMASLRINIREAEERIAARNRRTI